MSTSVIPAHWDPSVRFSWKYSPLEDRVKRLHKDKHFMVTTGEEKCDVCSKQIEEGIRAYWNKQYREKGVYAHRECVENALKEIKNRKEEFSNKRPVLSIAPARKVVNSSKPVFRDMTVEELIYEYAYLKGRQDEQASSED